MSFSERVKKVVSNIPKGSALSYKEVAVVAGSPKAYRAVGTIMSNNRDPSVPCHRVIRSDGRAGGYNQGGINVKRDILESEGVNINSI